MRIVQSSRTQPDMINIPKSQGKTALAMRQGFAEVDSLPGTVAARSTEWDRVRIGPKIRGINVNRPVTGRYYEANH